MTNIRPENLSSFNGQGLLVQNLRLFMNAAKNRGESLDHVLFHGPPGLGKTTLSQLISEEMGGRLVRSSGPVIENQRALMSLICGLERGDVLFIDEIHRLPTCVEEVLYTVIEDFRLDLVVGDGMDARPVSISLEPFTLVGATTRAGSLSRPLLDRFPISFRLDFYSVEEMIPIIESAGIRKGVNLVGFSRKIAERSRGTPRIGIKLVSRISDFITTHPHVELEQIIDLALEKLQIFPLGLDSEDIRYLLFLVNNKHPAGLGTISAAIAETQESIEDVIEPFLLRNGLVARTSRGRELTEIGRSYLVDVGLIACEPLGEKSTTPS